MYVFYNANKNKIFTNDCVVRAISTAENKTWGETYDELSRIARRNGIILDDVNFVEPLLDSRYPRVCYKDKTVGEFAMNHKRGTYLLTVNGHITCCINGNIVDTWDCTHKKLKCAWIVKKGY